MYFSCGINCRKTAGGIAARQWRENNDWERLLRSQHVNSAHVFNLRVPAYLCLNAPRAQGRLMAAGLPSGPYRPPSARRRTL
jgi:hypothetical protein